MKKRLLKVPTSGSDQHEQDFNLAYYISLDVATRFPMVVTRSEMLVRLANENSHAADPEPPALTKRL